MTIITLIRRQSPDWQTLSTDYRRGVTISPERYLPREDIPYFPPNVPECVDRWNELFAIDFFTCRLALAQIAQLHNSQAPTVRRLDVRQADEVRLLAGSPALVFYHDDDDVFDVVRLASGEFGTHAAHVSVFPMIRVHGELVTFTPDGVTPDLLIGSKQSFHFRYQTNNYALNASRLTPAMLVAMKDHVNASDFAEESRLVDERFSATVAATIKTPASASRLPRLLDDDFRQKDFSAFLENLQRPDLAQARWLRDTIVRVRLLFEAIICGDTANQLAAQGIMTD